MDNIDLTQFEEDGGFTIKLVGPSGLIAADTLIEVLAGFRESLRAIGDTVDPQFDLEVYVTSVEPGSVNIVIQLQQHLKKRAASYAVAALAAAATPGVHRDIIVGLFTNYLYDQIRPQERCEVAVEVGKDEDKITVKGNCNVTIRRQVHDLKPRIDGNPKVAEGVGRALRAAKKDRAVKSVGIGVKPDAPPAVIMPRGSLDDALRRLDYRAKLLGSERPIAIKQDPPTVLPKTRTQDVPATLTVIKAILLRSKRKWEFNWQGHKISARIADPSFFDQLGDRVVELRQGDALDATLTILQGYVPDANVWENLGYTVTKVHSVKVGETQTRMNFTPPNSAEHPGPLTLRDAIEKARRDRLERGGPPG